MIKLGVHSLPQLLSKGRLTNFGAERKVSITLLNQVLDLPDCGHHHEQILFGFSDDRGAYKRTATSRFEEFDDRALATVQEHCDCTRLVRVHDAGVSNAQTAVDFYHRMAAACPDLEYQASDYDPHVTIIRSGRLAVGLSSNDNVVEVAYPPFVFHPYKLERALLYPVNHIVRMLLLKFAVPDLVRRYQAGQLSAAQIEHVALFCPAAQQLQASPASFDLLQHDLLNPGLTDFTCFRAMNVLNDTYFSDAQFGVVLSNIWQALNRGGLFITGSNMDAGTQVQGGVYRKLDGGFEPLWQSGAPTIRRHIDALRMCDTNLHDPGVPAVSPGIS